MKYEIFNNDTVIDELKSGFVKNWRNLIMNPATVITSTVGINGPNFRDYVTIKSRRYVGPVFEDSRIGDEYWKIPYVPFAIGTPHQGVFSLYNADYVIEREILITKASLASFVLSLMTQTWASDSLRLLFGVTDEETANYAPCSREEIRRLINDKSTYRDNVRKLPEAICDAVEAAVKSSGLEDMSAAFDWMISVLEGYFWNIYHNVTSSEGLLLVSSGYGSKFSNLRWKRFTTPMEYHGKKEKRTAWINNGQDSYGKIALLARAIYMCPVSMFPERQKIAELVGAGDVDAGS